MLRLVSLDPRRKRCPDHTILPRSRVRLAVKSLYPYSTVRRTLPEFRVFVHGSQITTQLATAGLGFRDRFNLQTLHPCFSGSRASKCICWRTFHRTMIECRIVEISVLKSWRGAPCAARALIWRSFDSASDADALASHS